MISSKTIVYYDAEFDEIFTCTDGVFLEVTEGTLLGGFTGKITERLNLGFCIKLGEL